MRQTKAVFQVSRGASATTLVISTMLAATVTGGAPRSLLQQMPGAVTCPIMLAVLTGAATMSKMAFLSVASGIRGELKVKS